MVDSGEFSGLPVDEGLEKIVEWLREQGRGAPAISYRLRDWSFSRQRYWGCPIPVVYCEDDGVVPCPRISCPSSCRRSRIPAEGKPPLASNEEWINVPCPKCGKPAARGGHDGHVRRLVLVLPALLRPAQRPGAVGSAARRLLDAGRPVRRRHRPRDRAPAVLALLRQGAERLRPARLPRAVPAPVPPGLGATGRDEDVQVQGERDRPRPAGGHVRGGRGPDVHPVQGPCRPGHGLDRGGRRGRRTLHAPAVADRERGRRAGSARRDGPDRPGPRRSPDDREGDRRHRPPLPVQHADRGGHGAGERAGARAG